MQQSTETRWFFHEKSEIVEIEKWFERFSLKLDKTDFERQDYYLKLPGVTSIGLKIREPKMDLLGSWKGKLEAKVLVKELGPLTLENNNSGRANQWTKFSFALPAGEETMMEILDNFLPENYFADNDADGHWIKMEKNRVLVKYNLESKKFLEDEQEIHEGCGIELTGIKLNNARFYSFGLESFSTSGKHESNFFETLNFVLNQSAIQGLSVENSMGYPEFLSSKI